MSSLRLLSGVALSATSRLLLLTSATRTLRTLPPPRRPAAAPARPSLDITARAFSILLPCRPPAAIASALQSIIPAGLLYTASNKSRGAATVLLLLLFPAFGALSLDFTVLCNKHAKREVGGAVTQVCKP